MSKMLHAHFDGLKASVGKFRVVTCVDSDNYQIGEDVDTLESAETLCRVCGDMIGGSQVYDDQGQPQLK